MNCLEHKHNWMQFESSFNNDRKEKMLKFLLSPVQLADIVRENENKSQTKTGANG